MQPKWNYLWFLGLLLFAGLRLWREDRRKGLKAASYLILANSLLCIYFILAYYFEPLAQRLGRLLLPLAILSAFYTFWNVWQELRARFARKSSLWRGISAGLYELLLFGPAFCAGI